MDHKLSVCGKENEFKHVVKIVQNIFGFAISLMKGERGAVSGLKLHGHIG